MLKISRRADYAVRIMVEMGVLGQGNQIMSHILAEKTSVPMAFLRKIVADLAKAHLVQTYSGPKGGVMLAQSPQQINMKQIIEAVEGPLVLNVCLLRPGECPQDISCPAADFWAELQTIVLDKLQSVTLDQLVASAKDLRVKPRYRDLPYLYPAQAPAMD